MGKFNLIKIFKKTGLTAKDAQPFLEQLIDIAGAKANKMTAEQQQQTQAAPPAAPSKEEIADSIIEKLVAGEKVSATAARTAGKSLAGRFCFSIEPQSFSGDTVTVLITPIKHFENKGYEEWFAETPVRHLLPKGADEADNAGEWYWKNEGKSRLEVAEDLLRRGFVWRRDFQEFNNNRSGVDKDDLIGALEKKLTPPPPPSDSSAPPAPSKRRGSHPH